MRLKTGGKVGNFFRRIGKGIKRGAQWAYNTGRKVVNKVREYAPKVIDTIRLKIVKKCEKSEKIMGKVRKNYGKLSIAQALEQK